ncbi:hypothetical protein PG999_014565 [Apiospora kogelbergensis]|uniref:Uncharacterized protein n=1 Tax=Apiospora kogelbergensis TaxID=1337665 RepID=A0AAW0QEP1_9PEZI
MVNLIGPEWPQEATAQAFAWLDHCNKHHIPFRETIYDHLKSTTDMNFKGFGWLRVAKHMTTYAKSQNQSKPYMEVKARMKKGESRNSMDILLERGTTMVANLTGDAPMAKRIADIKASLDEDHIDTDSPPAEVKEEENNDEIVADTAIYDTFSDDNDDPSDQESSHSEYMENSHKRMGTGRRVSKKRRMHRQQSSPPQFRSPKRVRVSVERAQLARDDELEEPSRDSASNEGFGAFIRRLLPSTRAAPPRQVYAQNTEQETEEEQDEDQERRRPHSAPMVVPDLYRRPQTPSGNRPESPEMSPLTPEQTYAQSLVQPGDLSAHPVVISETPQAARSRDLAHDHVAHNLTQASEDSETQQPTAQASYATARGPQSQLSHAAHFSEQNESPLARENARLHQMLIQKDAEIQTWKQTSSTLTTILSAPGNSDKSLNMKYTTMCNRFKSREGMQNRLYEATERGLPGLRRGDLARRFSALQSEILRACYSFSLADMNKTLTTSSSSVSNGNGRSLRDQKMAMLVETACGSTFNAWELRHDDQASSDLFRALIAAHVFRFAFESRFPSRYTGHDSAILTEYHKMRFEQDGAKVLFVSDRLALKYFVENKKPFDDLIKVKSRELATEAAQLLAPLSAPTNVVADSLRSVYALALRLKSDTVLSSHTYAARFVRPGSRINADTETALEIDYDFGKLRGQHAIKLGLFPIIYSKPIPEVDSVTTEMRECLVNYANFAVSSELRYDDIPGGEIMLHKGMVRV